MSLGKSRRNFPSSTCLPDQLTKLAWIGRHATQYNGRVRWLCVPKCALKDPCDRLAGRLLHAGRPAAPCCGFDRLQSQNVKVKRHKSANHTTSNAKPNTSRSTRTTETRKKAPTAHVGGES